MVSWVGRCTELNIDSHARECATNYVIFAYYIAKLATSDMHALDTKYHRKCLIALYNHACSTKMMRQMTQIINQCPINQ